MIVNNKQIARLDWLDIAKGVGIVLVVFGHVFRGVFLKAQPDNEIYLMIDSIVYSFHMPLFFFLSGLMVKNSIEKRSSKVFVLSKVDTILYAYILWMVLQGVLESFFANISNKGDMDILSVFNFLIPRSQFWYLYTLFILMCFVVFLKGRNSFYCFLVVVVLTGVYMLFAREDIMIAKFFTRFSLYFFIGVLVSYFHSRFFVLFNGRYSVLMWGLLFVFSQYSFHFHFGYKYDYYGAYTLVLALVSIMFVLSISNYLSMFHGGLFCTFMVRLGKASILIYLGHLITAAGLRIFIMRFFPEVDSYTLVIICTLFGMLPWYFIFYYAKSASYLYDGSFLRKSGR